MIGGDLPGYRHREPGNPGSALLSAVDLSLPTDDPFGTALENVHLEVRGGEILGIAGVSGNGQRELLSVLSGEQTIEARDNILLDGAAIGHLDPQQRRELGLCSVPEDRLGRGSVPALSLLDNSLLTVNRDGAVSHGMIRFDRIAAFAKRCIADFEVRCSGPAAKAGSLSGGNLQKFIVGREILQEPIVLIVSQPTWGVDVGAAIVIRQALLDLRARGAAILVISEELDELFEIADRIAVIAGGRLTEAKPTGLTDRNEIGIAMSGSGPLSMNAARQDDHALAV
jgi:simple sugar transport system ATP-binding protein